MHLLLKARIISVLKEARTSFIHLILCLVSNHGSLTVFKPGITFSDFVFIKTIVNGSLERENKLNLHVYAVLGTNLKLQLILARDFQAFFCVKPVVVRRKAFVLCMATILKHVGVFRCFIFRYCMSSLGSFFLNK